MQKQEALGASPRRRLLVALAAGGCASTPRRRAARRPNARWNGARASVLFSLAKDQYKTGNFDKCRKTRRRRAEARPAERAAPHPLGQARHRAGPARAGRAASWTIARKLAPNDAEADYLSGVVYQRWQKPRDGLRVLHRRRRTRRPASWRTCWRRREMLVALDRSDEALTLLQDKVVVLREQRRHPRRGRAAARSQTGQATTRPSTCSARRAILATDDCSIREHLGLALFYAKQYREAADVAGEAGRRRRRTASAPDLLARAGRVPAPDRQARATPAQTLRDAPRSSTPSNAERLARPRPRPRWSCNDFRRAELALTQGAGARRRAAPRRTCCSATSACGRSKLKEALAGVPEGQRARPRRTPSASA